MNGAQVKTLFEMLSVKRPDGCRAEKAWITKHLVPLGVERDRMGNAIKRVGEAPRILWSAHTDTVHRVGGPQKFTVSKDGNFLMAADTCLGADNGAGVWLLMEMIRAGVEGLYVFHRGEECGARGSRFITEHRADMLKGLEAAVAFDRRGTTSVITEQWCGRTCSDAFGLSLANALGLGHKLDDGGSFTDTANYIKLIGECTNVSVGFYNEHSANEALNLPYLLRLRAALITADLSGLNFARKPGEASRSRWSRWFADNEDDDKYVWLQGADGTCRRHWKQEAVNEVEQDLYDKLDKGAAALLSSRGVTLAALCRAHPLEVADLLESFGYDEQNLALDLFARGAHIKADY